MDSSKLFQSVFVPVFATKLASLGYPVRSEEDLKNLLKLAGQLKAVGAKSSLEVKSDTYKMASEVMAAQLRAEAKTEKTAVVDPTVLAGIAGLGAAGGIATAGPHDNRSTLEKGLRGSVTGLGTVGGAAAGGVAGNALAEIISKKLKHDKATTGSTKALVSALTSLLGGGVGYNLTAHKG